VRGVIGPRANPRANRSRNLRASIAKLAGWLKLWCRRAGGLVGAIIPRIVNEAEQSRDGPGATDTRERMGLRRFPRVEGARASALRLSDWPEVMATGAACGNRTREPRGAASAEKLGTASNRNGLRRSPNFPD
jgi:hypothetical protein